MFIRSAKPMKSPTTRALSSFRRGCVPLDANALGESESGSRQLAEWHINPDLVIETSYSA
jgi:hypothetical protein